MISSLLNIRNIAIIAALFATALAVQTLRVKAKSNKIVKMQVEIQRLDTALDMALTANRSNQSTIVKLSQANQECALTRELNEQQAQAELTRHRGRITGIENKYDRIKSKLPNKGCLYTMHIDDALLDQLYKD